MFAAVLIVFPTRLLLTTNIVLLVAGPVLLLVLAFTKNYVMRNRLQELFPEISHEDRVRHSIWQRWWNSFKAMAWLGDLWRMGKFWLALVVGIGLQILLVLGYVKLNPFVCYILSSRRNQLTSTSYPDRIFSSISRPRINIVPILSIDCPASQLLHCRFPCSPRTTKAHYPIPDIYIDLASPPRIHDNSREVSYRGIIFY